MKKIKNDIIYALILVLVYLVRHIPRNIAIRIFGSIGSMVFSVAGKEKEKTLRHLELVFKNKWPQAKIYRCGRSVFKNLGQNLVDVVQLHNINRDFFFRNHVDVEGLEYLENAYKPGKGVVCLSAHIGAFELISHFLAWKGYEICVTGAPIYDPRLNDLVVKNRITDGITYIQRGEHSARRIIRHLRQGKLFGVLPDQDTRLESEFIPFLGLEAFTPSAPVVLAMKMNARVVPIFICMQKNLKHRICISKEIELQNTGNFQKDLLANMTLCNDIISLRIIQNPEQWVWMHERWKTRRLQC